MSPPHGSSFPTDFLQNTLSHRTREECEGDVEVGSVVEYILSMGGYGMPITTQLTTLWNLPSHESTKRRTDLNFGTCSSWSILRNQASKEGAWEGLLWSMSTPGRLGPEDFSKHGLHLLHAVIHFLSKDG